MTANTLAASLKAHSPAPGNGLHVPQLPGWAVPAAIAMLVVLAIAMVRRLQASRGPQLDPQRLFTAAQRLRCFTRANNQCEHKPLLWTRCREVPTQGDHIYPWSKGGATVMSNQAALCRTHNARKSNHVPSAFYIWRLERRRRGYFPQHESVRVEWRIGVGR